MTFRRIYISLHIRKLVSFAQYFIEWHQLFHDVRFATNYRRKVVTRPLHNRNETGKKIVDGKYMSGSTDIPKVLNGQGGFQMVQRSSNPVSTRKRKDKLKTHLRSNEVLINIELQKM